MGGIYRHYFSERCWHRGLQLVDLNVGELRELLAALHQTDISELILKSADFELTLRKPGAMTVVAASPAPPEAPASPMPIAPVAPTTPAPAPVPPHRRPESCRDYLPYGGHFLPFACP
jgi:biotin carboxyl carrier protein